MIASSKGNSGSWEVVGNVVGTTGTGGTKGQQLLPLFSTRRPWRGETKWRDGLVIFAEFFVVGKFSSISNMWLKFPTQEVAFGN